MVKILLRFPHGLGDCTQVTVVLKHLRKYRPAWEVDVVAGRGKHTAMTGLCHHAYYDGETRPPDHYYNTIKDMPWNENYNRYPDRPNSKITNCLQEDFGLDYDPSLGRYTVCVEQPAIHRAMLWLTSAGCVGNGGRYNAVIIHHEGNTSAWKKNLAHWQVAPLIDLIHKAGRVPVLFDWDRRSSLLSDPRIKNPGCMDKDVWGGFGSGDAQTIGAMISLVEAYIGIDSGPGKIASATETPSLICWKGHHPIQFHDPAPNTTHLVPAAHRSLPPAADSEAIWRYFEKHYQFLTYEGDHDLTTVAANWLAKTLGCEASGGEMTAIQFALPGGIGDVAWALTKIRSVAAGRDIEILLAGDPRQEVNNRAVPFLRRFPFIKKVTVCDVPMLHSTQEPADSRGRYRYLPDGPRGGVHYLVPNTVLEQGRRLEDWLPEHPTDYDVFKEFDWNNTSKGEILADTLTPFAAFYLGPEKGHTDEGHNRGWLWEPRHWIELGKAMKERKIEVAVVGAAYDRSFWTRYAKQGVEEAGLRWFDLIGQLEIGETLALLRRAKVLISYQCGLGVMNHYLGGRTAMWWRPEGDSIHPRHLISFDERMKDAWIRPGWEANYMGCVYGRQSPAEIMTEIDRRGWLK